MNTRAADRLPAALLVSGLTLSLLLGLVTAALGAALPLLRSTYGLPQGHGTEVVVGYNLGALLALLTCGPLERHRPVRTVRTLLLAAFAGGCLGAALAPAWWLLTVFVVLAGAGFGGLILHLNTVFGRAGGARGVRRLNLLHAAFGAGATVGPLLVGELGALTALLTGTAVLSALCLPFRAAADTAPPGHRDRPGPTAPPGAPLLTAFAAVALLYAGAEAGIGALESTHLAALGHSATDAARLSAFFWSGLTAGRLALPLLAHRLTPLPLILTALLTGAAALGVATAGGPAPAAYGLAGLALAGTFPTLLAWATTVLPAPQRVTAVLLTANLVGSATLPLALAWLTNPARPASIPLALAGLVLLSALGALLAARRAARARPPAAPATPAVPHR